MKELTSKNTNFHTQNSLPVSLYRLRLASHIAYKA